MSDRVDLGGSGGRKLDSIVISSRFSDNVKTFIFGYDYFLASDEGGNYLEGKDNWYGATEQTVSSRLKLLSFTEKAVEPKQYLFNYNETIPLPKKTSYATDHWGYFNGENNQTFMPKLFSVLEFNDEVEPYLENIDLYEGAKRGASASFMSACILKSITYPTKGRTEFEFEPHSFNNVIVLSAEDESVYSHNTQHDLYDLNYLDGSADEYTKVTFDLAVEQVVDFMVHFNNKDGEFDFNELSGTGMHLFRIVEGSGPDLLNYWEPEFFESGEVYSQTFEEQISLTPGKYYVIINLTNDLGFQGYSPLALASIKYKDFARSQIPENYQSIGGGLRIHEITNYDSNGDFIDAKEFIYQDNTGTSNGKLIAKLKYADLRSVSRIQYVSSGINIGHCNRYWYDAITLDNNNATILSSSPINAVVGYNEVVTRQKTKAGSVSNGYTISKFYNSDNVGYFFEDIVINDDILVYNGKTITKSYFNSSDIKIKLDSFKYKIDNWERDWTNVKVEKNYVGDPCQGGDGGSCAGDPGGYLIGVYAYVSFSSHIKEKYSILIENSDSLITKTEYLYHPTNLQLSNEKTWKSDGSYLENQYYYPSDNSAVYSLMVELNMINPIVESVVLNNDTEIQRIRTEYTLVDDLNHIKPYKVDESRFGSNVRKIKSLDRYDGGNLVQFKNLSDVNVTVLWGYSGTLPIAVVRNATYNEVSSVLTVEVIEKLRDEPKTDEDIRAALGILRDSLPESQITIYTYDLMFGMTSETDPNGVTSYYEYDGMGRLSVIKDFEENVLRRYKYHFKQ